jgi:hypothetical protein
MFPKNDGDTDNQPSNLDDNKTIYLETQFLPSLKESQKYLEDIQEIKELTNGNRYYRLFENNFEVII